MKTGIKSVGNRFFAYMNGEIVCRSKHEAHAKRMLEKAMANAAASEESDEVESNVSTRFNINQRFDFLTKAVKMVAKGLQASAVISGSGGLGKSFTVNKALVASGLTNFSAIAMEEGAPVRRAKTFVVVKGYSTAKGLYRTLFENNDSVIVFDDCDSVLKDPVALNLLKGALDSYDTRIISWNADMRDEDLPRSFIFTGRVIFISNMQESKIDQAIRSRSAVVDVSMTLAEIVERMAFMINEAEFLPEFDLRIKKEALAFIDSMKSKMRDVSLRTLITVCKVRAADEDGTWKEMAEYLTCK